MDSPLNDFEPLDLEELPSQTVFLAHLGGDRATAEVRLDLAIDRTHCGFAHHFLIPINFQTKNRISDWIQNPDLLPGVRGILNRKANQT